MNQLYKFKTIDKGPYHYNHKLHNVYVSSYSIAGAGVSKIETTKFGTGGKGTLTLLRPVNSETSIFRTIATTGARLIGLRVIGKASKVHQQQWCLLSFAGANIAETKTTSDPLPAEKVTLGYEKVEWAYSHDSNTRSEPFNIAYTEIKWDYPAPR